MHDKGGHQNKKCTYTRVVLHYWWKGLCPDVDESVRTCRKCQFGASNRTVEELHPMLENAL